MKRIVPVLIAVLLISAALACEENIAVSNDATPIPATPEPPDEVIVETDFITPPVTQLIVTSEDDLPDPDELESMTSLRLIDLTALPYTSSEEIAELSLCCPPDVEIIWNQMLTDGIFRSDSVSLTLPNATAEDVNLLSVFSDLRYVDATGSTEYLKLYAFQAAHPEIEVHYAWKLGDQTYSERDEAVSVPEGVDPETFLDELRAFPCVREIDLSACDWDTVWIESLKKSFPDVRVRYNVRLAGLVFDSDSEMLDLRAVPNVSPDALIEKLSAFPRLRTVALPKEWPEADRTRIEEAFPSLTIVGTISAYGKTIDGGTEELDLSKNKIKTTEEIETLLTNLPFLKKLVLCDCGLSNEQMESLCDAYPEIRFVWTIEIGKRKLRTDAIGFSTKNPSKYTHSNASDKYNESVKKAVRLYEGDIEALKYCTDLEALDLGHNFLTNNDLLVISKLTKLKILILADNKITDISVLTSLQDLEYIELFMNKIPDLSPLCELPKLRDVNVCNTGVSDLSPLFSLTSAKRLWYAMNPFNRDQAKALKEALTDCECNYTAKDETADGWRTDPRYRWMRAYFEDS